MSSFSESEALRLIKDSGTNVGIIAWSCRVGKVEKNLRRAQQAADSAVSAISLRWITACASLSFHLQGSFLRDTTADSWAGSTPLASASNHPTMIRRKCGTEAARWVSTPNRSWEANADCSAEKCQNTFIPLLAASLSLRCLWHASPCRQPYWLHCFHSGSELPDTRRTDGPKPGPLPPQRSLWIRLETQLLVQPHV